MAPIQPDWSCPLSTIRTVGQVDCGNPSACSELEPEGNEIGKEPLNWVTAKSPVVQGRPAVAFGALTETTLTFKLAKTTWSSFGFENERFNGVAGFPGRSPVAFALIVHG